MWPLLPEGVCHRWLFAYLPVAWLVLEHKEQHRTVWMVGPCGSFPYNSARIKVRLWPKLITRISHETGMCVHSTKRSCDIAYQCDTTQRKTRTKWLRERIMVKRDFQLSITWSFKANHFCTLTFRNRKEL